MHKTPILLALCCTMCTRPLFASFEYSPTDPGSLGMAGAMTALPADAYGIFHNPASPSTGTGVDAGVAWTLPYGDPDLKTLAGGFSYSRLPFDRNGALSVGVIRHGGDNYREETFVAGYSRALTGAIRAGFSVSRLSQEMRGSGSDSTTGVNAGLQAEVQPGLIFGVSSFNLNAPSIGDTKTKLSRTTLAGLSFRLETGTILTLNALTDPERSSRLLTAGEFMVTRNLHMMLGVATNPSVISGGARLAVGPIESAIAVCRNLDLGTTASFGVEVKL